MPPVGFGPAIPENEQTQAHPFRPRGHWDRLPSYLMLQFNSLSEKTHLKQPKINQSGFLLVLLFSKRWGNFASRSGRCHYNQVPVKLMLAGGSLNAKPNHLCLTTAMW